MKYPLKGENCTSSEKLTYLNIKDKTAANQFFEFAAENTTVEFSQNEINFSDGFSANLITTNHLSNVSVGVNIAFPDISVEGHILSSGTWSENVHSHNGPGDYAPSGYAAVFNKNTVSYVINASQFGDGDSGVTQQQGLKRYIYSPSLKNRIGGGYVQYNNKSATYKGNSK